MEAKRWGGEGVWRRGVEVREWRLEVRGVEVIYIPHIIFSASTITTTINNNILQNMTSSSPGKSPSALEFWQRCSPPVSPSPGGRFPPSQTPSGCCTAG